MDNEAEKQTKKLIRSVETKDGKLAYKCRMCGQGLTDAVLFHGLEQSESVHRAHHYMTTRDRILKYAAECAAYTKANSGAVDMTKYTMMVGAVAELNSLYGK